MMDRLTQMLETEDAKINIQSRINTTQDNKDVPLTKNDASYSNSSENKNDTKNKINKIHSILDEKEVKDISRYSYLQGVDSKSINNNNTAEILNMALELKESKKTIEIMKNIIEDLKREIKAKEETYNNSIKDKLQMQKFEFDNILQRQTGLIEGLLSEKKKQTNIIDELSERLETSEKTSQKKISHLMENFDLEIKRNKDAWFQAEKLRRKKWEDQKVKEIKELTVKGLEPEIERILANHKQEITQLEDRYTEDTRKQREKFNNEYERKTQDIKERFLKDKEEALDHERNIASQRLRNQNERLEEEHNEERRRWNAQLSAEIARLETLREKDKKLYEDQIAQIENRSNKLTGDKEDYYKNKIIELEKRNKEQIESECQNFKIKYDKEKEKFVEEKTRELENKFKEMKNELNKDRDKQIQIVIEKLGDETINERRKIQSECEHKADSMNKALRAENEQMKLKIQELSDKLAAESKVRIMLDENLDTLSRKLQDKERDNTKKEKQLNELNSNYNNINDKYSNIIKDFNREKLDIELEYKSKFARVENELRMLNDKNESLKAAYDNKINEIQSKHKEEIVEIEEKIKKTFSRKEDLIKKLNDELQMKDITIGKYEELLAKQRKELLFNN